MNSANLLPLFSQLAAPAFFDMLAAAGLGALVPAIVMEIISLTSGKVMPFKFAQQTASLFVAFMATATIAFLGGVIILGRSLPWLHTWLLSTQSPALPMLIAWGTALLFGTVYAFTFPALRNRKFVHILIGLPGMLAALSTFPLTIAAAPDLLHALAAGQEPPLHPLVIPGPASLIWPFAVQFLLLGVALAGGLGMIFILYRRKRDDWGRDYYNYALPAAARWAAPFMLLQQGGMAWLLAGISPADRDLLLHSAFGPVLGAGALLAVICCILWICVWRSRTPMRLKGLVIAGGLLCWAAHLCAVTMAFVLLPAA